MHRLFSSPFLISLRRFASAHKIISTVLSLIILYGCWHALSALRGTSTETRFVLATVTRGTIVSSVSASGQVAATDEITLKPKASGDVTWVGVKAGTVVRAGQALLTLDSTDATQAIADAEQSLAQAKLQLQKDTAQAPIDYEKSLEDLDQAKRDLTTTYNDTFTTVSDAYLALPAVVTGVFNVLHGYDLSSTKSQWNIDAMQNIFSSTESEYQTVHDFADITLRDYALARKKYDASLLEYKALTRYSESAAIEMALTDSVDATTAVAQALQSLLNLFDTLIDAAGQRSLTLNSAIPAMRTSTQGYLSIANSRLSALLSEQKALESAKKSIRDKERSIEIYKIGNPTGADPISLQSTVHSLANQERSLQQLKDNLADYTVTAPFSGSIATLTVKRYDSVGTGTSIGTLIASQKVATLSLNEVDATKIKVGNKATLTFDALEGVTLTGAVAEIDPVGTVSQGVVSYTLKIAFDAQDDRVKPGMTVNAAIISAVRSDVLSVPGSAVRMQGGSTSVLVVDPPLTETGGTQGVILATAPTVVPVTVGISDESATEILSGLAEGAQVVVRTITAPSATTAAAPSAPTLFGAGTGRIGGGGGGGNRNATFIQR